MSDNLRENTRAPHSKFDQSCDSIKQTDVRRRRNFQRQQGRWHPCRYNGGCTKLHSEDQALLTGEDELFLLRGELESDRSRDCDFGDQPGDVNATSGLHLSVGARSSNQECETRNAASSTDPQDWDTWSSVLFPDATMDHDVDVSMDGGASAWPLRGDSVTAAEVEG